MSRPLTVRKPNADELHRLHQWLEQPLKSWQRRRAEVLLLYAADGSASAIAQLLHVHRHTAYADLRAFARHGLSALSRPRTLGAPPRLSKKQIAAIWRLADRAPTT
jgi:transposase